MLHTLDTLQHTALYTDMSDTAIILASSSPRRHELLSRLGIPFDIVSAEIDETLFEKETPDQYIKRMVEKKAEAVMKSMSSATHTLPIHSNLSNQSAKRLLLTCDTIGVMPNGKDILVKPTDRDDAMRMWQQMSDDFHHVWTAVQATLIHLSDEPVPNNAITGKVDIVWQQQIIEKTKVQFIELTQAEMQQYWETGEPADKAGGYAIQGKAASWVSRIEGSYTNVVGLPLAQTKQLIQDAMSAG